MSHFLIEGPGGIPQIALQKGYNSALPITTTGLITGGSAQINGNLVVTGTLMAGSETTTSQVITAASANAFAVGANGTTNPAFNVDASTASSATGVNIKSAAAAGGVVISAISSGTDESITLTPKGAGTLNLATNHGFTAIGGNVGVASTSANALAVGPANVTNPTLNVDSSVGSVVTGLNIQGQASGGGLTITTISSGSNEALTIAAKGTGAITFNPAIVAAAGGKVSSGIQYGSIAVGLYTGTGAPSFSAMNGSIYTDSNATTTTTRIYVNKSGAGTAGTTWTALTTAA